MAEIFRTQFMLNSAEICARNLTPEQARFDCVAAIRQKMLFSGWKTDLGWDIFMDDDTFGVSIRNRHPGALNGWFVKSLALVLDAINPFLVPFFSDVASSTFCAVIDPKTRSVATLYAEWQACNTNFVVKSFSAGFGTCARESIVVVDARNWRSIESDNLLGDAFEIRE